MSTAHDTGADVFAVLLRERVNAATNAAITMITDQFDVSEETEDLLALMANLVIALAANPDLTLDQVIEQEYDEPPAKFLAGF